MKRKIICISIIGLLLLTGVASFPVLANQIEKNTPVVKLGEADSTIIIRGGRSISVIIFPDKSVRKDYFYSISVQFNGDDGDDCPLLDSGGCRFVNFYNTGSLSLLRRDPDFNFHSQSGSVVVTVKITKNDQQSDPVQTVIKQGSFSGGRITI